MREACMLDDGRVDLVHRRERTQHADKVDEELKHVGVSQRDFELVVKAECGHGPAEVGEMAGEASAH